jgi:thioredoxin reductase (NADPH)
LGIPSEETYANRGVSACAVCDGFFYRGKAVAVVGAGDSAAEEATYLANLCPKVHLIVRRGEMRASKIMQQRVINNPAIQIHWNTETEEIVGNDHGVSGARLLNTKTGEREEIHIEGFFLAIGHKPNTDIFKGILDMDESGYVKVQPGTTKTNVEGVYAVGDVADRVYRQAITAAGTGCMGALDAERFLAAKEAEHCAV